MLNKTIFQYRTCIRHDSSELLRDLNYLSCLLTAQISIASKIYLSKSVKCNLEDEAIKQTILLNSHLNSLQNEFHERSTISPLRKWTNLYQAWLVELKPYSPPKATEQNIS